MNFKYIVLKIMKKMFLYSEFIYIYLKKYLCNEEMEILYQVSMDSHSLKKENKLMSYKYLEQCTYSTFQWCLEMNILSTNLYKASILNYASLNPNHCTSNSIIPYLCTHIPEKYQILTYNAAYTGNLELLCWLHAEGFQLNIGVYMKAVKGGHLRVLYWLYTHNNLYFQYDSYCAEAAHCGHLHVIKWLRSLNPPSPWCTLTCAFAADNQDLDMLKWLRQQKPPCQWDKNTTLGIAWNGNVEMLKWVRSQDPPCPWDESVYLSASQNGHINILEWLRNQNTDFTWNKWCCFICSPEWSPRSSKMVTSTRSSLSMGQRRVYNRSWLCTSRCSSFSKIVRII